MFAIKDNSEWSEFVDSVCRSYGFSKKTCPLVYTLEGTLIGDGRAFVDHVRERYNKSLTITKENQKNRAKINIDENDERMRKKKEGDALGVKIINVLERLKKKDVAQLIGDSFYTQETEDGIPFYARRTNLLRDMKVSKGDATVINSNKTVNIPDEMLCRQVELKATAQEESKRDRTYEEFEQMYGDHLAGLVDP